MLNSFITIGVIVEKSKLTIDEQTRKYLMSLKIRIPNSNGRKIIVTLDCVAYGIVAKKLNFINKGSVISLQGEIMNFNNLNVVAINTFSLLSNNKLIDIDEIEEIYNPKKVTDFNTK